MIILNVLIPMTGVAKTGDKRVHVLDEVHPIAHKTSCPEYCKCKQIELIISLYACADLFYTEVCTSGEIIWLCHRTIIL